jgi:anti-anti-sigma factor
MLSRWTSEYSSGRVRTSRQIDVRLDRVPGAVVVCVRCELDMASSPELEVSIRLATTSGRPLIVDLTECAFIDCSVLSVLTRAHRWLGGNIRVVVPDNAPIRKLFALAKLVDAFGVVPAL